MNATFAVFGFAALALLPPVALARNASDPYRNIPSAERARDFDSYPLDRVSRDVDARHVRCPDVHLVSYQGTTVRLARAARFAEAFVPHVQEFERIVARVAIEVYGRAPSRINHLGTYNCRVIRAFPDLLSEHGLGNAIDVSGFEFAAAPRDATVPTDLPRALRRGFNVTILAHWHSTRGVGVVHARFLERLREELASRPALFRGMLGPAYPGHRNHLHLDMAPWSLIWM